MASSSNLDALEFDPSDTSNSANVGAYLRAGSDGDLITSTDVGGGKEALDINIAGSDIDLTVSKLAA